MIGKRKNTIYIVIQVAILLVLSLVVTAELNPVQGQSGTVSRAELILAINTLRVSYGLPPLIEDPIVNAVAQSTAETMAANNMSWHIGDVRGRIAAAGYGGGATVWATENFAVGNLSIDEIMQFWADPDHMRPVSNPAYCHVGAGVAQAANGQYYYVLQAAYTSDHACGEYKSAPGDNTGSDASSNLPVSQYITPVRIATPDADGRIYHIVQAGQSFWSIAIAYQITIRDLEIWNNLSREKDLIVGQKLFIPSEGTEGYSTPVPPGLVQIATPDEKGNIIHIVEPYQALIMIAKAYGTTVDRILTLNGLQVDWPLQIGQKLLVESDNITPVATDRPLSPIERLTPAADGNYYHAVQEGEYLAWIASLYEVSVGELTGWNGLTSGSIIRPGQQLLLRVTPPATATPEPVTPAPSITPTSSPAAIMTPTPSDRSPTVSVTSETEKLKTQSDSNLGILSLLGILIIAGVIILLWSVRRSNTS